MAATRYASGDLARPRHKTARGGRPARSGSDRIRSCSLDHDRAVRGGNLPRTYVFPRQSGQQGRNGYASDGSRQGKGLNRTAELRTPLITAFHNQRHTRIRVSRIDCCRNGA